MIILLGPQPCNQFQVSAVASGVFLAAPPACLGSFFCFTPVVVTLTKCVTWRLIEVSILHHLQLQNGDWSWHLFHISQWITMFMTGKAPMPGFLSLCPIDTLGPVILCGRGCPAPCRKFSSIPGLHSFTDASSTLYTPPQLRKSKLSPDMAKLVQGDETSLDEKHWPGQQSTGLCCVCVRCRLRVPALSWWHGTRRCILLPEFSGWLGRPTFPGFFLRGCHDCTNILQSCRFQPPQHPDPLPLGPCSGAIPPLMRAEEVEEALDIKLLCNTQSTVQKSVLLSHPGWHRVDLGVKTNCLALTTLTSGSYLLPCEQCRLSSCKLFTAENKQRAKQPPSTTAAASLTNVSTFLTERWERN